MELPAKLYSINPAKMRDAINTVVDYLRSSRLVAGSGVALTRLASGTVLSAAKNKQSAGGGRESSLGAFDISYDSVAGKIRIYDSSNPSSSNAGVVYTDNQMHEVAVQKLSPSSGYVYVRAKYEYDEKKKKGTYSVSVGISTTRPKASDDDPFFVEVLGKVTVSDSTTTVTRMRSPGDIHAYRKAEVELPEPVKGPFYCYYDEGSNKIKVKEGYVLRNGEFANSPEDTVTPSRGYICVTTSLDSGRWTTPACHIASPSANNYPIGYCHVSGGTVTVDSYNVPVAVFIVTEECGEQPR